MLLGGVLLGGMLLVSVGASALASGLMRALLALCLLLTVVNSCSRPAPVNDRAEVEKAIQDYVNSRPILSPSAMSIEVEQVSFQGDQAEATVLFHGRDEVQSSVALRYVLRRTGSRTWVVEPDKTKGVTSALPGASAEAPHR